MTTRQILLKAIYPLLMLRSRWFPRRGDVLYNTGRLSPNVSFYTLSATANDGAVLNFESLRGKKVLIVNTASDCGYTGQYEALEQLYRQCPGLVVLGFPANDFKQQEQGSDAEIAVFCKINFGVSFPLMQKTQVVKGDAQNAVFHWLSHAEQNGWCTQQPSWNFSKYIIDEQGILQAFFRHDISPLDSRVTDLLR